MTDNKKLPNWLVCLGYGIGVGVAVGVIVVLFKLVAEWVIKESAYLYGLVANNPVWIALLIVALAVIATAMHFVQKWCKESKGGGIPRAEGAITGVLSLRPIRTAVAVVTNSLLSFLAGLPLGSEGPSVLLGTSVGGAISNLPLGKDYKRIILASGASAGFAVATCAPLSGVVFVFEEILKELKPVALTVVGLAVATATMVSNGILDLFGHHPEPLFNIQITANFALDTLWVPFVLGAAVGFGAFGFNQLVYLCGKLNKKLFKSAWLKYVVLFVTIGVVGVFLPQLLGGGAGVIQDVSNVAFPLITLVVLLIAKSIAVSLSNSSGATGGMFIPLLCVGALVGALCGRLFVVMGMSEDVFPLVVLVASATFMGASTGAPLTATVFVMEYSNTSVAPYVLIVALVSSFVMHVFKQNNLYDVNLHNLVQEESCAISN